MYGYKTVGVVWVGLHVFVLVVSGDRFVNNYVYAVINVAIVLILS